MTSRYTPLEVILLRGTEDVVSEEEVFAIVEDFTSINDEPSVRAMAVGLMAEVMARGWMVPQTLGTPWNMPIWIAVQYLAEQWALRVKKSDRAQDLCWLVSIVEGKRLGISIGEADGSVFKWDGAPFASKGRFENRT